MRLPGLWTILNHMQGGGGEQPMLRATDRLDDGSVIAVAIQIDPESGEAYISFEQTDPELYGNLNAPKAVVYSAVIYVLRCLVRHDIPLNQVWCKRVASVGCFGDLLMERIAKYENLKAA